MGSRHTLPGWDDLEFARDDLLLEADDWSELRDLEELGSPYMGNAEVDEELEAMLRLDAGIEPVWLQSQKLR